MQRELGEMSRSDQPLALIQNILWRTFDEQRTASSYSDKGVMSTSARSTAVEQHGNQKAALLDEEGDLTPKVSSLVNKDAD